MSSNILCWIEYVAEFDDLSLLLSTCGGIHSLHALSNIRPRRTSSQTPSLLLSLAVYGLLMRAKGEKKKGNSQLIHYGFHQLLPP